MPEYMEISFLAKSVFGDALKSSLPRIHVFGVLPKIANLAFSYSCIPWKERWHFMRKKNYKGAKCTKRYVNKCDDVCKTYDAIQYVYANLLSETEEVKSFQVNVLLQGLEEGAYTSDFVITKADGNLMVRECVSRKHLTKPMTTKVLDVSRNYWKSHGVSDWGIVIEEGGEAYEQSRYEKRNASKRKSWSRRKNISGVGLERKSACA